MLLSGLSFSLQLLDLAQVRIPLVDFAAHIQLVIQDKAVGSGLASSYLKYCWLLGIKKNQMFLAEVTISHMNYHFVSKATFFMNLASCDLASLTLLLMSSVTLILASFIRLALFNTSSRSLKILP